MSTPASAAPPTPSSSGSGAARRRLQTEQLAFVGARGEVSYPGLIHNNGAQLCTRGKQPAERVRSAPGQRSQSPPQSPHTAHAHSPPPPPPPQQKALLAPSPELRSRSRGSAAPTPHDGDFLLLPLCLPASMPACLPAATQQRSSPAPPAPGALGVSGRASRGPASAVPRHVAGERRGEAGRGGAE